MVGDELTVLVASSCLGNAGRFFQADLLASPADSSILVVAMRLTRWGEQQDEESEVGQRCGAQFAHLRCHKY